MSKKSRERTPELEEIAAQLGSMNTQEDDTITSPVVEIFRQLKKYFLPWVLVAVILAGLVFGGSMVERKRVLSLEDREEIYFFRESRLLDSISSACG